MSAKIKYTNEPLGNPRVVADFLPRPEDLVFQDEGVKVTIALSKRSVDFFKIEAQKNNTQYQRMIRRLLDAYAEHHSQLLTAGSRRAQKTPPDRNRQRASHFGARLLDMSDADVAEILKLPPEERLRLVELLWESLAATPAAVPVGDAHRIAIDEELSEHRRNPDDVLKLDELLSAIRKAK